MTLTDEIAKHRAEIRSDGYSMSVGELISMYKEKELYIRPQFQRFFRWSDSQKSRLIESLLLGIPLPSIFVSQRSDGVWDVIDGQQRLSTILQFVGILRDEDDKCLDPLVLLNTKYLPSLQDKVWSTVDSSISIGHGNQLLIKRSKIDVKIILRESSEGSKFELFQRLNTGGSPLSRQEMRNVIALMIDNTFYEWMVDLAETPDFKLCADLSERQIEEQYDRELVLRFLSLGRLPDTELHIGDVGDFLDDVTERFASDREFDRDHEQRVFTETFRALRGYGNDIFKRFDGTRDRHVGGFLISAFEVFAIGLSFHFRENPDVSVNANALPNLIKDTWMDSRFINAIGSGVRASFRIPKIIPYARDQLRKCLSEH